MRTLYRQTYTWMLANVHEHETATALAETAQAEFEIPTDQDWVWTMAADMIDARDNGDLYDTDNDDGPDQSDREPSHGPDYWRDPETGEYRLG